MLLLQSVDKCNLLILLIPFIMTIQDITILEGTSSDVNNNDIVSAELLTDHKGMRIQSGEDFIQRRLKLCGNEFLIVPNGASGDCMFKAVCQAVFNMNEQNHSTLRTRLVDFVLECKWEKFKESIEIQHFSGNNALLKKWKANPKKAYHNYMKTLGTLGSSSELHAAGEMLTFNFATIQEYSESANKTYRVENCCHFPNLHMDIPFHFFLFTGDYDNGHWEYLKPIEPFDPNPNTLNIPDGLYLANTITIIQGSETTVDDWLKIHTENTNDIFGLKHSANKTPRKLSTHPFEWDIFQFESKGTVRLQDHLFTISDLTHTDLFTVLGYVLLRDAENGVYMDRDRLEEQILDHRRSNFSELNQKLITQPHSHGFALSNFKYLSMSSKGNIQDLLAAADLFGFSFQVFLKSSPVHPIQACKFLHIDRWGGEADKMEYFFMKLISPSNDDDSVFSKWWHLTPLKYNSVSTIMDDENQNVGDGCTLPQSPIKTSSKINLPQATASQHSSKGTEQANKEKIHSSSNSSTNRQTDDDLGNVIDVNSKEGIKRSSADVVTLRKSSSAKIKGESPQGESNTELNTSPSGKQDKHNMPADEKKLKSHQTSFEKIHNNFWKGKSRISLPNGVINKLPKITLDKKGWKLQEGNVSRKGNEQSKKFKTVVELYDEKSQRRKKYVYDGYIEQESILEALYLQGCIKRPPSSADGKEVKHNVRSRKASAVKSQQLVLPKKNSSALKIPSNKNLVDIEGEEAPKPIQIQVVKYNDTVVDLRTPSDYAVHKFKTSSPSVIPLIDADSIARTNKFQNMHRRLAPKEKKDKVEPKKEGCFRKFLSWIFSFFKK